MNYQEAEHLLSTINKNPYLYNGKLFTAIIVPEILDDRIKYLSDLKESKVTENKSLPYSTNNEFVIWGYENESFNL